MLALVFVTLSELGSRHTTDCSRTSSRTGDASVLTEHHGTGREMCFIPTAGHRVNPIHTIMTRDSNYIKRINKQINNQQEIIKLLKVKQKKRKSYRMRHS